MSGEVDHSPEGQGSARGSQRPGRPPGGSRPSFGAPEGLSRGPVASGGSSWERQFEAENQRRQREVRRAEELLASRDLEPGRTAGDDHEIVWITPDLGCCPLCQKTYRRAKIPSEKGYRYSPQSAPDMDNYMRRNGLFDKSMQVLDRRQAERKAKEEERDTKRRGGKKADFSGIIPGR